VPLLPQDCRSCGEGGADWGQLLVFFGRGFMFNPSARCLISPYIYDLLTTAWMEVW